ncbi:MAG: hypothetical protein SVX43_04530, partial [Cyanobacteriota bacterium]|nr:hypothetical protein [Cyanobacteriota bacterium]
MHPFNDRARQSFQSVLSSFDVDASEQFVVGSSGLKSEGLMLQFPSAALGLRASMLNLSKHHLQREYYYDLIQQLIGKHTLKIWSLMCSFVLFTGALAAVGLLDPGYDPADAQHNPSAPGLAAEPL